MVRYYGYNCSNALREDFYKCKTKSISFIRLHDIVKEAVSQEFSLSDMKLKDLTENNNRESERIKKEWNDELSGLDKQIADIKKAGSEQYLKYRMGEIKAESFKQIKEENDKKILFYQHRKKVIEEKLQMIDYETIQKNHFLRAVAKGSEKCVNRFAIEIGGHNSVFPSLLPDEKRLQRDCPECPFAIFGSGNRLA